MALHTDNEDIWKWYKINQQWQQSKLSMSEFCRINNLEYKTFLNKSYRIVYKKFTHPELYEKLLPLARKFIDSKMSPSKFIKIHDVDKKSLTEMANHVRYLDIIEEMRPLKEKQQMNFIQVPTTKLIETITPEPEQELLKKQNDIELIISSGVKVVVSPDVGADKLIRIIELLKDL